MSEAFRQQWIRYSANKQMLTILNWLAKQKDIVIPIAELENTEPCVLVQEISSTSLTLHYAPPDTRMFVLGPEANTSERRPVQWQTTESHDPMIPPRLMDYLDPPMTSPLTTTDDKAMAEREQAMQRAAAAAEKSRVLRGQPLPVPTPLHPPQ